MVEVNLKFLLSIANQPERREMAGLAHGNALLFARWRYVLDLADRAKHIIPCEEYQSKIYAGDRKWNVKKCIQCTQWVMHGDHELLKFRVPANFPVEELHKDDRDAFLMKPRKLSFPMLRDAVKKCLSKFEQGKWDDPMCRAYMKSFGINGKTVDRLMEYATNEEYKDMEENYMYGGEAPMPTMWSHDLEFFQCIDAPMHLLFLGAAETTLNLQLKWCKSNYQYTALVRNAAGVLEQVQKLTISWCKAMPFLKGSLGGWVSESHLAFVRLSKWFMSLLHGIEKEDAYVDPDTNQSTWNKKENQSWLRARELKIGGSATELKERVANYLNATPVPELMGGRGGALENVLVLSRSLTRMICFAMSEKVDRDMLEEFDFCIKKFLCDFENLECNLRKATDKPKFVTCYNLCGLENLVDPWTYQELLGRRG